MEALVDTLCLLAQSKERNNPFKKQKNDNQGVKEETFILTGRRGGHRQSGQRGHVAKLWLADQAAGDGPGAHIRRGWRVGRMCG